jgi:hypothetical protein
MSSICPVNGSKKRRKKRMMKSREEHECMLHFLDVLEKESQTTREQGCSVSIKNIHLDSFLNQEMTQNAIHRCERGLSG